MVGVIVGLATNISHDVHHFLKIYIHPKKLAPITIPTGATITITRRRTGRARARWYRSARWHYGLGATWWKFGNGRDGQSLADQALDALEISALLWGDK